MVIMFEYSNIQFKTVSFITERVGFEPTDAFTSAVFKTAAINHSATFPGYAIIIVYIR